LPSTPCPQCTFRTQVIDESSGAPQHKFTLQTGMCCCGRVNNCCGATCCKNDMVIDILNAQVGGCTAWRHLLPQGRVGVVDAVSWEGRQARRCRAPAP
jgi:hypothetical protein